MSEYENVGGPLWCKCDERGGGFQRQIPDANGTQEHERCGEQNQVLMLGEIRSRSQKGRRVFSKKGD